MMEEELQLQIISISGLFLMRFVDLKAFNLWLLVSTITQPAS